MYPETLQMNEFSKGGVFLRRALAAEAVAAKAVRKVLSAGNVDGSDTESILKLALKELF